MHEMMEFTTDFTIETSRPILESGVKPDYVFINEDLEHEERTTAQPRHLPHLHPPGAEAADRLVQVRRRALGHHRHRRQLRTGHPAFPGGEGPTASGPWSAPPTWTRWPFAGSSAAACACSRAGWTSAKLAKDFAAIDAHLRTLRPLVADGEFIPTVDHLVPPDVPLANFEH